MSTDAEKRAEIERMFLGLSVVDRLSDVDAVGQSKLPSAFLEGEAT